MTQEEELKERWGRRKAQIVQKKREQEKEADVNGRE